MWGRWFCTSCNNKTEAWDKEYARWRVAPLVSLHDPQNTGNRFAARAFDGDPGAFVRCLWSWMFAISDNLRETHPELAEAVLSGEPIAPPEDACLLLAATRDLQFGILALTRTIGVAAPPFVALLASRDFTWLGRGFFDTGPWLLEKAGLRREVEIELPIVHTFDPDDMPPVGEPVPE